MDQIVEETKPAVEEKEQEELETYHKPGWVFGIATAANILAAVTVIVFLIMPIWQIYDFTTQGGELAQITPLQWMGIVSGALPGLVYGLLLVGLTQGLYLLMDVYERFDLKG